MSTAATDFADSQYFEESVVSSQQWHWPPHSTFGSAKGQIIQILRKEPGRIPSPTKCMISIQGSTPDWVSVAANRLASIMRLPENWDSYGAKVVNVDSIFSTIQLLVAVMKQETPMPYILPTPMGGVQLEWHQFGIDLEAEVLPSGNYLIAFEDEFGAIEMFEEEHSSHPLTEIDPLLGFVDQLTERAKNARSI